MCIYPGSKYETLNFALHLCLYFSFTFDWAKRKMAAKTTSFLYFCYELLHDLWFLHDFVLINLGLMFFDQNDLYLTLKFKMVTANTQLKAFFMYVNYNIIKQHCLMGI